MQTKVERKSRDNSTAHFQLQQMQEQMNSMNDSGDFQDVESNKSGRLSHVSNQPSIDSEFAFFAQPRQKISD